MNCLRLYRFKRWYNYFKDDKCVLRRKSDGTLWIASYKDRATAMAALFTDEARFYFRRCKRFRGGYIICWNQTWEFTDYKEFEIYDNAGAI